MGYRFTVVEGGIGDFDGPEIGTYEHARRLKPDGNVEEIPERDSEILLDGRARNVVDYQLNPDASAAILVVEPLSDGDE